MIRDDLIRLTMRLTQGPVPTLQKKGYGYQGDINTLLDGLPPSITMRTRVTDLCQKNALPTQEDKIRAYLYDLTGDAHAIILHLEPGPHLRKWKFPSYVHYNPEAAAAYFVQALGGQFIREDQAEE
jgi:hypothetical protein